MVQTQGPYGRWNLDVKRGDQSVRLKNITGFTCWLRSVVVNLMAWKWVTVMCEGMLQYHS